MGWGGELYSKIKVQLYVCDIITNSTRRSSTAASWLIHGSQRRRINMPIRRTVIKETNAPYCLASMQIQLC